MSTVFRAVHGIRFSHCDPGGIVYFPHFFDFICATVEDWCDEAIATPETELLHRRLALPVVHTRCRFFKPSRIGDKFEMALAIARLGRSTIDLQITGSAGGEERLRARHVISMVSLDGYRPVPLPEAFRAQVEPYVLGADAIARDAADDGDVARPRKVFRTRHLLRFSHCDPAGILYFPNSFDMINATVEDWCREALGVPFDELHLQRRMGFPIVETACDFIKPSRIGEELTFELSILRLGRASVTMRISVMVAGEERMRARHTTSLVSLDAMRSVPIPAELRAKMEEYLVESADSQD